MQHFEKFSKEAKRALLVAQEEARSSGLTYVGTEHILLGILTQPESLGASVLLGYGVTAENVRLVLKTVGRARPQQPSTQPSEGGLSGFAKKVIEDAVRIAYQFNHALVGTEHLLYALMSQENTAATVILENMKVRPQEIRRSLEDIFREAQEAQQIPKGAHPLEILFGSLQAVMQRQNQQEGFEGDTEEQGATPMRAGGSGKQNGKNQKNSALAYFATDLTAEARAGKLDPVIGRDKEIERVITILNRKTKNNPVLIGEPGVGKTAIAEGLARAIVSEKVPASMLDKRIFMLSMTSLVAGTKYRGEFEDRFKKVIDEATKLGREVILFLDEIHTLIGTGAAEGSLDAANILKPALARGKIQLIGATTQDEYRKHIENDKALERRLQPVTVPEPSEEDAVLILQGLKKSFEKHHHLTIGEDALTAAVTFSKRYVPDRYLPDKAIDLVDEAASRKMMHVTPKRTDEVKKLKEELSKVIAEKESAVSGQDYENAANLRAKELQIKQQIDEQKVRPASTKDMPTVTKEDIAQVVASATGIPVGDIVAEDRARLHDLENVLKGRIVGQDSAIRAIAQSIRRSRTGLAAPNRPIGSFIFLGPTGVGKTELVKTLAREVYGSEDALIKIDMSEFMERHNVSRLTGATAGYVGYEEGGQLTEKIRRKPYSVVLFDEVEKAHKDTQNLLLQILEDGQLTDGKGRKADFRNAIIVMTSNIGADRMTRASGSLGFSVAQDEVAHAKQEFEDVKKDVLNRLEEYFRPEFLNRVDKVVVFEPLTRDTIEHIVSILFTDLQKRVAGQGIQLTLSPAALSHLADKSYDKRYGARPARRALTDLIEDELAGLLLDEKVQSGEMIAIDYDKKKAALTFLTASGKKPTRKTTAKKAPKKLPKTSEMP